LNSNNIYIIMTIPKFFTKGCYCLDNISSFTIFVSCLYVNTILCAVVFDCSNWLLIRIVSTGDTDLKNVVSKLCLFGITGLWRFFHLRGDSVSCIKSGIFSRVVPLFSPALTAQKSILSKSALTGKNSIFC